MRRSATTLLIMASAFACGVVAGAARGQDALDLRRDLRSDELRPVDPGLDDVGPLSTSLRVVPGGLLVPTGFGSVYPVPGHPGWLMRVNGGLYAVFRRSVYSDLGAEIPHNTTFSIGPPLFLPTDLLERSVTPEEIDPETDARIDTRLESIDQAADQEQRMDVVLPGDYALPALHKDESYRRERLAELMREAVASETD